MKTNNKEKQIKTTRQIKQEPELSVNVKVKDAQLNEMKVISGVVKKSQLLKLNSCKFLQLYLLDKSHKIKGYILINTDYIVDISSRQFFFKERRETYAKTAKNRV